MTAHGDDEVRRHKGCRTFVLRPRARPPSDPELPPRRSKSTYTLSHPPETARRRFSVQISVAECGHNLRLCPRFDRRLDSRVATQSGQLLLNHREQRHPPRSDDRERITSARQAAEALFTPKPQPVEPPISDPAPSAERPPRKPRVLSIQSPPPVRNEEVAAPVDPAPRTTRQIPRSEHARIRTWVHYGLTIPQVARVYGVAVGVIEGILGKA